MSENVEIKVSKQTVRVGGIAVVAAGVLLLLGFAFIAANSWEKQAKYYRYKADAYTGVIHQVMNVTKESNPEAFNSWAIRMNDINDSAAQYGVAAKNDRFATGVYTLDSSVITVPDSVETP